MGCLHLGSTCAEVVMAIAICDANSFYCEAEILFRPWLQGTPVAVASNNDGMIVSRNDPAKALGLKMGQPVFELRHLINSGQMTLFSSNYELYQSMSNRVMAVLGQVSPKLWTYSIDESFVDLSGMTDLERWGRSAKALVQSKTGLPIGVGIAETMTLSKLANWAAKKWKSKTGCVIYLDTPHKTEWLLRYADVGEVWGIGSRISARLNAEMGIKTAFDLTRADPKILRRNFSVNVERTARELMGQKCFDLGDGPVPKKMIASTRSFGARIFDQHSLESAVAGFVATAAEKLRAQGSFSQCMKVFAANSSFDSRPHYSRSVVIAMPHPTNDTRDFLAAARCAIADIYREGIGFYRAGVVLSEFSSIHGSMDDMFRPRARGDSGEVMAVMDKINSIHGRGTLRLASNKQNGKWAMSRDFLSSHSTTKWGHLPRAKA